MSLDQQRRTSARREPLGPALLDVIARAEVDPQSNEAKLVAELREVVAAVETPSDRLLANYRSWPSGPGCLYARRD
jgi:hypothetical protein